MKRAVFSALVFCMSGLGMYAWGGAVVVPATADIFSSGEATADAGRGGTLPVEVDLAPGANRIMQFSAAGSVIAGTFWPSVGPDGGTTGPFGSSYPTNITAASGISGMLDPQFEYLAGVFLNGTTPVAGTEPASLNFNTISTNFTNLDPLLQQSFAIGDGLTGTGTGQVQDFHIPDTATRMYLGFLDAYNFSGAPGEYSDDTGSFTVQYTAVPEPSSVTLIALITVGLTCFGRHCANGIREQFRN